jgi:hypothetical protein
VTDGEGMTLHAGDLVEVRSEEEILRSLDVNGRLEQLPFMPQMFNYCGKRFKVFKRAHKTCDTVNPVAGRRMHNAVHLDIRCDGKAYAGCQAGCLIFWKEAWLKPVGENSSAEFSTRPVSNISGASCTKENVSKAIFAQDQRGEKRYFCQATQLPYYTSPLSPWDVSQYFEDYRSGNVTLSQLFRGFIYITYYNLTLAKRNRLGRPARWLYDRFQTLWGGIPFPRRVGPIPVGQPTPTGTLDLQPGELVRVRSYQDILVTLDSHHKNQGMSFDAEQVPFCGKVFRVKTRVERFLNEKTGKLTTMKTPAVILEGVWCQSRYSNCRMFCPRAIYSWWRENWLERAKGDEPLGTR